MTTLFVNRLTVIDASLLDPERGLLGQSWLLDVEIDGALDHQGMVLDFAEVKRAIKNCIDLEFDHRLLVPVEYPGCQLELLDDRCHIRFGLASGECIDHRGPACASALIKAERIDEKSLAAAITERLSSRLPHNIQQIRLRLYAEEIQGASYQYSHGLKQHQGNCQRIAHGHRSRIMIYRNGERAPELETNWAARWQDIYLGCREDLRATLEREDECYLQFGYLAEQGEFELTLPRRACYLIETESTVENLARHIRVTLEQEHPHTDFRIVAYEGVDKGALSTTEPG